MWAFARQLLPYPDPIRRRHVRRDPGRLTTCSPWPGEDATALDVAQLAVLRGLALQRDTRRAALLRQQDATALLARVAIENCIVGLYCLHADDPVTRLHQGNVRDVGNLLRFLLTANALPEKLLDATVAAFGDPKRPFGVSDMADLVVKRWGSPVTKDLYERHYVPLLIFFVHANGLALLRHVDRDTKITLRPSYPWMRQSAVRVADACLGTLAFAVAERMGRPNKALGEYAAAHIQRAMPPVLTGVGQTLWSTINWTALPEAIRTGLTLRSAKLDDPDSPIPSDVRLVRFRDGINQMMAVVTPPGHSASD
jgi:hypothetical protein